MATESQPITAEALLAHAEWVYRLARALVRDPADASDLTQEVLAVAIQHPPSAEVPLPGWLAGVTRNLARLRWRTEQRRAHREAAAPPADEVPSPERLVERAQAHQRMTRLLLELDEPIRSTLLLRFYEGLSSAEIARRLELPPGTVRWRLKRGLDELRAQLDASEPEGSRRWALLLAPPAASPVATTSLLAQGVLLMKALKLAVGALFLILLAWLGAHTLASRPPSQAITATATSGPTQPRDKPRPVALAMREASSPRDPDPLGKLRLEGQVIDDEERPVGGAEVALDANPTRVLRSGADGSFVFENLIARPYQVEARAGDEHAGPTELRLTATSDPVILRLRRAGTLDLEVRAALSGAPIRNAVVELRSSLLWQARTDERGRAQLTGVGAGWPTLHVAAAGYAPLAMMLHASGDPHQAHRQVVSLARGAKVSGRVVDAQGRPVEGARVVAIATAEPFPVVDANRDAVITNVDGSWRIEALAAGSYRFYAWHPERAPGTTAPLGLDGEHAHDGVEIRLAPGATVRGRVVDERARPVASARVRLVGRSSLAWRFAREAHSDGDGIFVLRGLPERAVELSAAREDGASELVKLDLGGGGEHEVSLTISLRGVLEGLVVAPDGRELAGARVLAHPEWSGALGEREAWDARGQPSLLADGAGRFRFAGLPAGRYRVSAVRPGASDEVLYLAKGVAARTGNPAIKLVVPSDGHVRGRVAFSDGTTPALFTVEIGAAHPEPFSSADGQFELEAPGGPQRLVVTGPSFQQLSVPEVHVKPDETTELGLLTVEKGRSVSGRVLDASGQPVPDAQVAGGLLLTGNGAQLNIPSEGFRVQETQSDREGRYLLRGFGEYPIVVVAERNGAGRSPSVRIPRGGASTELDLVLRPTGSLHGKVTRNGQPLPETVVIANPRGARSSNFFVQTGPDGSYAFDVLSAGDYVVFPVLGGGNIKPKDMFYKAVTILAEHRTDADLVASYGTASANVRVRGADGQPVGAAQVLVIGGSLTAPNLESLNEGLWLPGNGQIVPAYLRMALAGAPARIEGLQPGLYSFCAVPLAADPNDPIAMRGMREQASSLPMQCVGAAVEDSREQNVDVRIGQATNGRR